jgi:hypothetical protein
MLPILFLSRNGCLLPAAAMAANFFWVGIHRAYCILQILYWIYEIAIHILAFILDLSTNIGTWKICYFFVAGNCFFIVCLTVYENVGMLENYRFMMASESQEKKKEIY